jgi:hypothetical protein
MNDNSWSRLGSVVVGVTLAVLLNVITAPGLAEEPTVSQSTSACDTAFTPAMTGKPVLDGALVPPVTSAPPVTPMAHPCGFCHRFGTTATTWGMGADCTAAAASLADNLGLLGENACISVGDTPCGITDIVIVTACHFYEGSYRTDGYATYKCRPCHP